MRKLYITNKNYSSWSLRPWVLMRQVGIEFEEELVQLRATGLASGFGRFSPSGRVPCLVEDGITVWDSLAITEFLAEGHPGVWPSDKVARAWARSAAAEMHSGFTTMRSICTMSCGIRVRLREVSEGLAADWGRVDRLWGEGLERFGGPFLAGAAFTAVDAFFAPVAFRAQTYSPALSQRGVDYVQRLLDLPAMKEWYSAALAEPWREEAHEEEARAVGEWTADLRAAAV